MESIFRHMAKDCLLVLAQNERAARIMRALSMSPCHTRIVFFQRQQITRRSQNSLAIFSDAQQSPKFQPHFAASKLSIKRPHTSHTLFAFQAPLLKRLATMASQAEQQGDQSCQYCKNEMSAMFASLLWDILAVSSLAQVAWCACTQRLLARC